MRWAKDIVAQILVQNYVLFYNILVVKDLDNEGNSWCNNILIMLNTITATSNLINKDPYASLPPR